MKIPTLLLFDVVLNSFRRMLKINLLNGCYCIHCFGCECIHCFVNCCCILCSHRLFKTITSVFKIRLLFHNIMALTVRIMKSLLLFCFWVFHFQHSFYFVILRTKGILITFAKTGFNQANTYYWLMKNIFLSPRRGRGRWDGECILNIWIIEICKN